MNLIINGKRRNFLKLCTQTKNDILKSIYVVFNVFLSQDNTKNNPFRSAKNFVLFRVQVCLSMCALLIL